MCGVLSTEKGHTQQKVVLTWCTRLTSFKVGRLVIRGIPLILGSSESGLKLESKLSLHHRLSQPQNIIKICDSSGKWSKRGKNHNTA